MPAVISKDLYGSTYAIGVAVANPEKVVRRHYVEGATSLENAISEVTSQVTDFASVYPTLSTMPLLARTAKQIGVEKFIVEEAYGWVNSSWGGSSLTNLADYRLAFEAVPVYTVGPADPATGIPPPTNALFDSAGNARLGIRPNSYSFLKPVLRVGVPIQSSTNPVITWASRVGQVNNSTYTVGGLTFTAGQLRFDGADITARGGTGYTYQGSLIFSGSPAWVGQKIDDSSGVWAVSNYNLYPSTAF
jgi:hypothetical protein